MAAHATRRYLVYSRQVPSSAVDESSWDAQECTDLGTMPGQWSNERWQPFDQKCQLEQWPRQSVGSQLRVMFFGDSIERLMAQDLSQMNASVCCQGELSAVCRQKCDQNSTVILEGWHNNGVWPQGPFFMNETLPLTAAQTWLQVSRLADYCRFVSKDNLQNGLLQATSDNAPDILVVSANFWDLGRWSRFQPEVLDVTTEGRALFQYQLRLWQQYFVDLLQLLQVSLSGAPKLERLAVSAHQPI